MNKIAIGIGIGLAAITAVILIVVYGDVVTAKDENNDGNPIQLIAACTGEGTELVSCTWIPLDKSKRTEAEQVLAKRAESN